MAKYITRKNWLRLHFWPGIIIGFFISLLGISGAVLLLKKPVLEWEIGKAVLYAPPVTGTSAFLSPDIWRQNAQMAYPELSRVMGEAAPGSGFIPATNAMVFGSVSGSDKLGIAFIDPVTGNPKGFIIFDDLIFSRIVSLHRTLLLPPVSGGWLVSLSGIILALSVISGIILWWPRRGWRQFISVLFLFRPGLQGAAKWRQWHYFFAVYFSLPLLLIAVTGIFLARPDILSVIPEYKLLITQLHRNMGIGMPGLIIAFISGILLPLLYISGIVIWLKKRKHQHNYTSSVNGNIK